MRKSGGIGPGGKLLLALLAVGCGSQASAANRAGTRAGVEFSRLAPHSSVPSVYYRESAAFLDACLADSVAPARPDTLCRDVRAAASRLDSNHHFDKGAYDRAASVRRALVPRFRTAARPDAFLADPDMLRKIRMIAYLESPRFLEFLASQPVDDTLPGVASTIHAELRRGAPAHLGVFSRLRALDSLPWARVNPDAREKLVLFLSKVDPALEAHVRMAARAAQAGLLAPLLASAEFRETFARYDYGRLLEDIGEDSVRQKITLPKAPAFSHRLKNLLHDAVWVEEMERAPAYLLSGFLLRGSHPLSPGDSALVASRVKAFGARHRDLAYRIDIGDSRTWKDDRYLKLDSLATQEVRRINSAVSRDLRAYLDREPVTDLRLILAGSSHADFLGPFKVYTRLREVLAGVSGYPGGDSRSWLPQVFPLVDEQGLLAAEEGKPEALKALRNSIGADPAVRNSILLALAPALWEEFRGTNLALMRMAEGRQRI